VACKHLFRIDGNERPGAARQNFTLGISDLCHVDVPPTFHTLFRTSYGKRLAERDRLEVFDFHGCGKGQHIAKLVHFAHGFIQDGCNDAAVHVPGRPGIFPRQLKMANRLARVFVQRELQAHALRIIMPAAKTMVLARFGFAEDCVTVRDFALCHVDRELILHHEMIPIVVHRRVAGLRNIRTDSKNIPA